MQHQPTSEKVAASIVAAEYPLNDMGETNYFKDYDLKEYVGSQELLKASPLFCSGSVFQLSEIKSILHFIVWFAKTACCSYKFNHLELQTKYTSFQEFS